jgi:hypothetical protein
MAGIQFIAGGTAMTDILPSARQWVGVVVLVVGGAQLAIATYDHGLVTPVPEDMRGGEDK